MTRLKYKKTKKQKTKKNKNKKSDTGRAVLEEGMAYLC
jgi:hypothetical protein